VTEVSDVLRDRMQEPGGLQNMLVLSLVAHALAMTGLLLAPGGWSSRADQLPRSVMTISLAGAGEGPRNGGLTAAAARPVQAQTPPEEAPKREAVRPPAAAPEMVLPTKTRVSPPSKTTPAPIVTQAPEQARGRTPTKGAKVSPGEALATTMVRGQGFGGLSTGGGPGSGSTLDVADFCCPGYLSTMLDRIRSAWNPNQGSLGQCIVKFTIQRDGQIPPQTVSVETSSGSITLDNAAQRAVVVNSKTLPPLPAEFPNSTLTVHLNFLYQ
jgi:outer membrane biosynthesis protein TonB